jgi:hypothetical protein
MSSLRVDHITIGGRRLDELRTRFAGVGLETTYGGRHHGNITEMALRVFEDGSYLELISTIEPGPRESVWRRQIEQDGGPAAWSLASDDLQSVAARAAALDIHVSPPVQQHRRRSDGQVAEWELLRLGDGEPGATYPFFIRDLTPRTVRVPQPPRESGPRAISGIGLVVLGVHSLEPTRGRLEGLLSLRDGGVLHDGLLNADVALYPAAGVALAAPASGEQDGWLARRLSRVGESPCAFLLSVRDLAAASASFDVVPATRWLDRDAAWFAPGALGMLVGLTHVAADSTDHTE